MPSFYSYARVERALAHAFEIPLDQRNRVTAKVKALMKQGLGASERQPGMRAEYSQGDTDRLLIAISLLNSCLDPQIVARTIEANFSAVPHEERRKILADNALRLYGFDKR